MKYKLLGLGLLLAAAAGLAAQTADPNQPLLGRGRGGAPYAWNDKDKDGICDITGRPVGQGFGGGRGRGRGWRAANAAQSGATAAPAQK